MNPIRILHVTRTIVQEEGEVGRTAVHIASGQAAMGHHVTLITMDHTQDLVHAEPEYHQLPGFGRIHLHVSRENGTTAALFGQNAQQWMTPVIGGSLSVVHVHGMWENLLRCAADLGRAHGVPVVVTPHPRTPAPAPRWSWLAIHTAMKLAWRGMVTRAAMVHALHDEDAPALRRMGVNGTLHVIPMDRDIARKVTEAYPLNGKLPAEVVCALSGTAL